MSLAETARFTGLETRATTVDNFTANPVKDYLALTDPAAKGGPTPCFLGEEKET